MWLLGGVRGCRGACVVVGGHVWLPGGACMAAGGGHVWFLGGICGCQGACMVGGACMVAGGACVVAGGPAWLWGGVVAGGGHRLR